MRDDHVKQWAYQGKPLYRYSGKDPVGEPVANDAIAGNAADPAWHDPASEVYSPKHGWRRAAYMPEKSTVMPPTVELDGLAIANGFGFVDAATHMTIYAAPVGHRLSSEWQPVRASALALPVGEFSIVQRKDYGTRQWTYKGEALYTYAGDYAPGEAYGIFTGDKSIQAALAYRNFMPPGVTIGHYVGHEPLMTTTKGQTLYYVSRFFPLYGGRETRAGYGITYNDAKKQGAEGCQGECTADLEAGARECECAGVGDSGKSLRVLMVLSSGSSRAVRSIPMSAIRNRAISRVTTATWSCTAELTGRSSMPMRAAIRGIRSNTSARSIWSPLWGRSRARKALILPARVMSALERWMTPIPLPAGGRCGSLNPLLRQRDAPLAAGGAAGAGRRGWEGTRRSPRRRRCRCGLLLAHGLHLLNTGGSSGH